MTRKKEKIDWHGIVQEILDEHLPLMSGKKVKRIGRERPHYYKLDYYCEVKGEAENQQDGQIKPFEHLKKKNIIEYKSMHEVLNEGMFRQYLARVLFAENPNREETYQGEMTLTILTTHTPKTVLACKEYGFKKIHRWKYESRFFKDLEIYLLIQREMKDIQGGEGLALLQVLEGEEERQKILWDALYQQENLNIKLMEEIMHKINKETAMNLAEHYKIEGEKIGIEKGKIEGKIEGKLEGKIEDTLKLLKLKLKKEVPATWKKAIEKINKENILDQLFEQIALSENPEELKRIIQKLI